MTASINLLYVHSREMGYGRLGMELADQLEKMGIEIFDHLAGSEDHYTLGAVDKGATQRAIDFGGVRSGRANVVCWVSVPSHGTGWYEGQIPVCLTMWEGMRLPEAFRQSFHEFETIICPSYHNLELFGQFHDNVKFVPLGVDPELWHFQPRQMPTKEFRFLHGGSGSRKGGDLVAKAFKKLWPRGTDFGERPVPTLTFKSPKGATEFGERMMTIGGKLSAEDEVALYANAHCYVQPSRGEGFGLQPLQAIAQGCPTILTGAHGHESYAHLGIPLNSSPVKSAYFIFGDAGDWWEPDFDELCQAMEDVYENYEKHIDYARTGSAVALHDFTWAETARRFVEAVGPERLEVPYIGTGVWHSVDEKQFKIITNCNWHCEIAGKNLMFYKGKEYWDSADIKRIMFEADVLDPCCLDDNDPDMSGLTTAQIERAGKYRAMHELCPTCGNPMRQFTEEAPAWDGGPLP